MDDPVDRERHGRSLGKSLEHQWWPIAIIQISPRMVPLLDSRAPQERVRDLGCRIWGWTRCWTAERARHAVTAPSPSFSALSPLFQH